MTDGAQGQRWVLQNKTADDSVLTFQLPKVLLGSLTFLML